MQKFSHTNEEGRAQMIDVGSKPDQERIAVAKGFISLKKETISLIRENKMQKGDVITVARIAGIQAAKQTAGIIPLCHALPLNYINVEEKMEEDGIEIMAKVKTIGKTGVEMEALTAVSSALLTIYDMCKAVDKQMVIKEIRLTEKKKY